MVTAFCSLGKVHGAELWLLYWAICVIVYAGGCLLVRWNRSKQGIKNLLVGLLIAEVIVDLIWAAIYYNHGTYVNHGIVAVYGLLVWIPVLLVAATIVTLKSGKNV
jgi:hypothetical protein